MHIQCSKAIKFMIAVEEKLRRRSASRSRKQLADQEVDSANSWLFKKLIVHIVLNLIEDMWCAGLMLISHWCKVLTNELRVM